MLKFIGGTIGIIFLIGLLVIIGIFTAVAFLTSKYWVYYEDSRS